MKNTKLPNFIWNYIFQFDSTYYYIFNKVLTELIDVTSMWKLHFHHNELSNKFTTENNLSLKQAKELSYYWNNSFLETYENDDYIKMYDKRNKFCSPVHISDTCSLKRYFPKIKANIVSYKIVSKWNKNI